MPMGRLSLACPTHEPLYEKKEQSMDANRGSFYKERNSQVLFGFQRAQAEKPELMPAIADLIDPLLIFPRKENYTDTTASGGDVSHFIPECPSPEGRLRLIDFELRRTRPSRSNMTSPTTFAQGSEELEVGRANLQAEAQCPICKKYFKDPVTIECGHNFCLACISEFWKDVKDSFSCPVCHINCPGRHLRSNDQLGKVTEVATPLPVRKSKRARLEGERPCETNQQRPAITCEKDQEVSRPQGSLSPSHTSDFVWPIENAYLCPRNEYCVKLWREIVEPAEKILATQRRRSLELRKRTERRQEELEFEYHQYRSYLRNERENILGQLQNEETGEADKLHENVEKFSDHIASLKCLLRK
ncbi:hypothetical protein STEG23_028609, partial [Scotinomys teguina]